MTNTVHDVIALLLSRSGGHLSISAIHKLCYYTQGFSLAWQDAPLFPEDLQLRSTGPVVPALYPFHIDNPFTAETWPAGEAAKLPEAAAQIIKAVFNSYGHMSGLTMGHNAAQEAPCIRAADRITEELPYPVIELADMKAFFKAFNDAPSDRVEYANRFIAHYV